MRALIVLLVSFLLSYSARAQSLPYEPGLYQFETEALNYSGVWSTETQGGISRQYTESDSVEFEVIGQTLVIQRRLCVDCGGMEIEIAGVLFVFDNDAPETIDYPLLLPLDTTEQTVTITADSGLWLDYFIVLDSAVSALPEMTPEPDSLPVYVIEPETRYDSISGQIVGIHHSVNAGDVTAGAILFAACLLALFATLAGEGAE